MSSPTSLAALMLELAGPILKHRAAAAHEKQATELAGYQKPGPKIRPLAAEILPQSAVTTIKATPPLEVHDGALVATKETIVAVELGSGGVKTFELAPGTKILLYAGMILIPPCKSIE